MMGELVCRSTRAVPRSTGARGATADCMRADGGPNAGMGPLLVTVTSA